MASARRAQEQPPALPTKQHRRSFSRSSSVGSECPLLSPAALQHHNDVFAEVTDCHAAQCPIHQRYDHSRHQQRFFSDSTPPPVPKKRLARTLSLPAADLPPRSPLSPSPIRSQCFDNPLYMLGPAALLQEEPQGALSPSLAQLSFDTPDEHLPHILNPFHDQKAVFRGIQHRQLLFLRSMAQSLEAGVLLQGDAASYRPKDFLISEGSQPKQIGDSVYYSLRTPKLPGKELALRVHKRADEASLGHTKHQRSHTNVRDVIAYFPASPEPSMSNCNAAPCPDGGSSEQAGDALTVQSLVLSGSSVSVERDLPHATLEDFVEERRRLQSAECSLYDRQVCVLLLQILMGSQHVCHVSASAPKLRPREVFLTWPDKAAGVRAEGGNIKTATGFKSTKIERSERLKEGEAGDNGQMQMLWRMHGAPRVVLTPLSPATSVPHLFTFIKSQIGTLIKYCLASDESTTPPSSAPVSPHRRGLLRLASQLQGEGSGPQMADMVAALQALLWGPHVPLCGYRGSTAAAAHNWLMVKQALMVIKLAERGLIQDHSPLDLEDWMCLQYLSFTDTEIIQSVNNQLCNTSDVE